MPLPSEPMLVFAAVASVCYAFLWWLWMAAVKDDGVELRYSEE